MTGVVYFLADGCGLIKVGHTKSMEFRLGQLETQEKKKLSLIGTIDGDYQSETRIHRQLKNWRRRGRDWFEDCEAVRSAVAAIIAKGLAPDESSDSPINLRCRAAAKALVAQEVRNGNPKSAAYAIVARKVGVSRTWLRAYIGGEGEPYFSSGVEMLLLAAELVERTKAPDSSAT